MAISRVSFRLVRSCVMVASSLFASCTLLVKTDNLAGSPNDAGADALADSTGPGDANLSSDSDASPALPRSCQDLMVSVPVPASGVYTLDPDGPGGIRPFPAYCETRTLEDGGGWTLVMKVDGTKLNFAYNDPSWTSASPINEGDVDLNTNEAKLAGFTALSIAQVRFGMNTGGKTRWVVVTVAAPSLLAVFSGGIDQATSVGRARWVALMPSAVVQPSCNREGFNISSDGTQSMPLRLGLIMNGEMECATPDTNIGLGQDSSTGISCGAYTDGSAGAPAGGMPAFCYLMVR